MKLLALETSTEYCSCALLLDGKLQFREALAGQRHSELLLPMVDELLSEAGVELSALDGIAFGAGPGSFTGLRIACGVAQGLAFGADLAVAPVGSLLALAQASGSSRVVSALDARMGEIYHAAYQRVAGHWTALHAPGLWHPASAPLPDGTGWTGAGSGFKVHGAALAQRFGAALDSVMADLIPHAREVALLGAEMLVRGEGISPDLAAPLYVRDHVALTISERAAGKRLGREDAGPAPRRTKGVA